MHILVHELRMFLPKHAAGSGMGNRACKISFLGVLVHQGAPSFYPDWHVGLVGAQMLSYLIILYIVVLKCVHGWAHVTMVEARSVHASD